MKVLNNILKSKFTTSAVMIGGALIAGAARAQSLKEMAAPISHPTVFEDPRSTTELRPIYLYHKIDDDFITKGGSVNLYALQIRYAVDERLSIIATKDGYVDLKTNEVLDDHKGWGDLGAGVKYAAYLNKEENEILSLGFRYEAPVGTEKVFQGQGKGAFNPFVSAAKSIGVVNVMAGTGFRIAASDEDSSMYDLNLHLDTNLGWLQPLVELNLNTVTNAGNRLPIADEGEDYFNFGASASSGETLVSASFGARVNFNDCTSFGVAYQIPLNDGAGTNILDYRVTTDLIFKL